MSPLLDFCDYTTIGACAIMKIPQMVTLMKTQRVDGVSLFGVFVELFGYLLVFCYNFVQGYALPTYFEYVFVIVQDFALIVILFKIAGTLDILKLGGLGLFAAMFYGFVLGIPDPQIIPFLIQFVTPISAFSKVIQLQEVWRTRNADSVSVMTWTLAMYTAGTRLITNLVKSDGPLIMNSSVALLLNLAMIFSALYLQLYKVVIKAPSDMDSDTESIQDQEGKKDKKNQ